MWPCRRAAESLYFLSCAARVRARGVSEIDLEIADIGRNKRREYRPPYFCDSAFVAADGALECVSYGLRLCCQGFVFCGVVLALFNILCFVVWKKPEFPQADTNHSK